MKTAVFVFVLAIPFAVACGSGGEVIEEEAGSADYILDNQTGRSLHIRWTASWELGGGEHTAEPVAPGTQVKFADDAIIGVNPLPRDSMSSLWLDDDGVPVYEQRPVDNDAWSVVRTDELAYGHAEITLVVTDAELAPDYGLPDATCCCEHTVEGDIVVEEAQPIEACGELVYGQCIVVDPGRVTPHACCPNATGTRCGS